MTEPETPHFQYEPFGDDRSQIRLAQVLPHLTNDGLIQLSMKNYSARSHRTSNGTDESDTAPIYSCLSYTWGDEQETHIICINGLPFHVRRNLWRFLVAVREQYTDHGGLRHREEPYMGVSDAYSLFPSCDVFLWIDALCIDQSNEHEKGHQVQRMGEIYRHADLVFIWLFLDSADESILQRIHCAELSSIDTDPLLNELVAAKYWSRAWITQEISLARKPVFLMMSGLYDFGAVAKTLMDQDFRYYNATFTELYDLYQGSSSMRPTKPDRGYVEASRIDLIRLLGELTEHSYLRQCAILDNTQFTIRAPATRLLPTEDDCWQCSACGWESSNTFRWGQDHTILCLTSNVCKSSSTHLVAIQSADSCKPRQVFHAEECEQEMSGVIVAYESETYTTWRLSMSCLLSVSILEDGASRISGPLCERIISRTSGTPQLDRSGPKRTPAERERIIEKMMLMSFASDLDS